MKKQTPLTPEQFAQAPCGALLIVDNNEEKFQFVDEPIIEAESPNYIVRMLKSFRRKTADTFILVRGTNTLTNEEFKHMFFLLKDAVLQTS